MSPKSNILLTIAVLLSLCHWANTKLFSAIEEVEPLLETHKRIIDDLDKYIEEEEARLEPLKNHLSQYRKGHDKAMEDILNYLDNPINAFTLIKRLTVGLDVIQQSIKKGTEYSKNIIMNHPGFKYPTLEDLADAAHALAKLQETYQLNINGLTEGMLNEVENSIPMTTHDCFLLGKTLYSDKDYKNAIAWLTESLRKYTKADSYMYPFNKVDILEYIAYAHFLLGDVKSALTWSNKILAEDPNHVRARGNVLAYTEMIMKEKEEINREVCKKTGDITAVENSGQSPEDRHNTFKALCRGDLELSSKITRRLKCWYTSEHHAFRKYAPFKVEQVYIKPDLFIFHEVLSDDEIEFVKIIALPKLKKSLVGTYNSTMVARSSRSRISKVSWIPDKESPVMARVSRRVADMTGLSMISAEDWQVLNYGIGGHYLPHWDFATKHETPKKNYSGRGNRIATVLFYMSDVAQGGATVFTEIGVSLFPIKGTAAFWMNLHPSGEGDMATMHGACPVLKGSKWAMTKWIHLVGQEFLKPCNLEYQAEGIARKLLRPVPKISR